MWLGFLKKCFLKRITLQKSVGKYIATIADQKKVVDIKSRLIPKIR